MLLVTGGAGFIGSNVVADLNEAGHTDVVVNDMLGSDGKWRQRDLTITQARLRRGARRSHRVGTGRNMAAGESGRLCCL